MSASSSPIDRRGPATSVVQARAARCACIAVCALALGLLHSAQADAQAWFERGRPNDAPPSLRLGALNIEAGIGAEAGWVSNVFLADDDQASTALRVSPHVYLWTEPAPVGQARSRKLDVEASLKGAFKHYFASEADTDLEIGQDARLALRPGSILGLDVFEEFRRSIDPFTDPLPPVAGAQSVSYGRDRFGIGTRVQFSSVGEVLRAGLGYRFELDHFESDAFRDDRNRKHTLFTDLTWEFYPRTALFWNANVGMLAYSGVGDAPRVSRRDGTYVDSRVGLRGAITQRVSATASLGYALALPDNDHTYETWIGELEVRMRVGETWTWAFGCERSLGPAFQGDYASVNRIQSRVELRPLPALLLGLRADVGFIDFGRDGVLASVGADSERDDILLRAQLSGEYRLLAWLALTAEVGYQQNFSDFVFPLPGAPGDEAAYAQLQAWLGVRTFL